MKSQGEVDKDLQERADIRSRALYGRGIDEIADHLRAEVWHDIYREKRERDRYAHPTPGVCCHCGGAAMHERAFECATCHEGLSVHTRSDVSPRAPMPLLPSNEVYRKRFVVKLKKGGGSNVEASS